MAYERLQRAYPRPWLIPHVTHRQFLPDRWTGAIDLRWEILEGHPVVIGSGRVSIEGGARPQPPPEIRYGRRKIAGKWVQVEVEAPPPAASQPTLVAEIVESRSAPVLPGSSLKGAVRQVYEFLTPSCPQDWKDEKGKRKIRTCRIQSGDNPRYCPACSLFGGAGLAGRLTFGEARAKTGEHALHPSLRVPIAWPPKEDKVKDGCYRIYDLDPAWNEEARRARKLKERTQGVSGTFTGRIRLLNASDQELGLLFASLGIGASSPGIRLGGKKFHGFGAADVAVVEVHERFGGSCSSEGLSPDEWARGLCDRFLRAPERRKAWEELHRVISRKGARDADT